MRLWEDMMVACFKILSQHSFGEKEKTHHPIRISSNILIGTKYLSKI
jgi:hypothetical protein